METSYSIDLLKMPTWSYKQIMMFANVGKTTAIKIKDRVIKDYNGRVPYGIHLVKVESVLKLFGTDLKKEIERLTYIKEKEDELSKRNLQD